MRPRILVVDDDPVTLRLAESALKSRCQVTTAADGAAALDAARKLRPDLVLTDLMMPVLDGLGLKRELGADAELAWTPVIFLTARSDEEAKLAGLVSGADDFLTKPIDPETLRRRVHAILVRSSAIRQASVRSFTQAIDGALVPDVAPAIPGWEMAFTVEPASAGGGDVVDVMPLDDGSHLLLFADVMGKGPRAKFFAYAFLGYLRGLLYGAQAAGQVTQPAAMVDLLNRLYGRDPLLQDMFVTAFVARLHARRGSIATCCAGAVPGYLVRATGGPLLRLGAGGGIPGFYPDPYIDATAELHPGDTLVLVSDGLTEASDGDASMLGEDGVAAVLESLAGAPAAAVRDRLVAAAQARRGGAPRHDDTSVLVLRRLEPCSTPGGEPTCT